jgi:hypothetical protein
MKKLFVLFGLLAMCSVAQAALLVNGDFEDPVANADWQNIDIDTEAGLLTGWTLIAPEAGHIATLYSSNFDFWGALPGLTNGQYLVSTLSSRLWLRLLVKPLYSATMSV